MKEWRKKVRRILVLLLTAALIGNTVDFPVFAVSAVENRETGLCRHHQSHTVECGYSEEDNMPCGYECRICPMEDLIAALPDAESVTENNADEVRTQLDAILDLYRELSEDEQDQIDLSPCWDLQAALDPANEPVTVDEPTEGDVARVEMPDGTTTYVSALADAFAAGNSGAKITLLANVDIGKTGLTVLRDTNFTLDCGNFTLSGGDDVGTLQVKSGGALTFVGGTVRGTGAGATVLVNGTFTMSGGVLDSTSSYALVVNNNNNVHVTVTGGTVGVSGSGLYVNDNSKATIALSGGTYSSIYPGREGTYGNYTYHPVSSILAPGYALKGADGFIRGDATGMQKTVTVVECTHDGAATPNADGATHGGECPYCGTEFEAAPHTLGADNKCEGCKTPLVASVKIGNATTYYGGIEPAWTAACAAESATVTLLANVTVNYMMVTGGNDITFDGGEFTLTGPSNNNKFIDITGGKLTVTGGTLKTGETTSGLLSADIIISRGELVVTGGSLEAGTGWVGLVVGGNALVKLSGGTFHGIRMNAPTDTVGRLLLNYGDASAETHYAYYQDGKPIEMTGQTVLEGTVTVKECGHTGVSKTSNDNGTHSLKCPYCGYTGEAEDCTYGTEYQHDDTNHWKTCTVCQGTTTSEAHYLRVTADEPVNGVTQNREACDYCDFTKNPFTVTVTVPSGLTYGNTVGIKPSYTISTEKTFNAVQLVLEDGEGNKNWLEGDTLPDDLSAGSYKLHLKGVVSDNPLPVFVGRAYFTVAPAQLTGDMVKLSPESVPYSGAEQKPTITVKQGETTLKEGTDYDVTYSTTDFTNAGKVIVTIEGKGNYTGTVETAYTIKKAPLTVTASSQTITYGGSITQGADNVSATGLCSGDRLDGITLTASTANVPGGNITPSAAGIKNSGGKDVTGNYEITYKDGGLTINKADAEITVGTGTYSKTFGDAAFTLDVTDNNTEADVQYEVTGGTDVVSVSNGTVTIQNVGTATIIVSLPETANYNAAESKTITVSVAKKDGYTVSEINKNYYYDKENAANISLTALLPPNCGTIMYGEPATSGDVTFTAVDVENGMLSYALAKGNINDEGTLTVPVTMRNYTDITVTVKVKLTEQIPVELKEGTEVTLVNNTLTYGESLSNLEFNEAVFVDNDGDTVKGTLAWKEAAAKPNAGTTSAVWVFTPDRPEYASLEGVEAITVNKAAPTVSGMPTVADRVYNPSITLKDGDLSSITVTGVDGASLEGTWNWQSADSIPTVNNSGYEAVFTPEDTTNYEIITRTITVTVIKAVPYIAELPTAAGITYGDTLDVSALSGGTVLHGDGSGQAGNGVGITETVAGAFTWKEPSTKPVVADSNVTEYTIVFTPSDTVNYNSVEAAVKLTVNKAQSAPNMPGSVMDVSNSIEKVGDVALPEGWEWQASDKDTALEVGAAVSAVAVYTGADKGNYENETVTVAITRSSCDHVAGDVLYTGEGEKEPTCTGEGLGHRECTKCGSVVESGIVVPTLGHHYKSEVTAEPTTDREGIRTYTCSRCGEQYRESIPKLTDSTEKTVSLTKVKIKGIASEKKKQLTVSWNQVEGADGYEVIYASNKSFTKNKVTKKTTKTSLTLKKLNEKKTWYVKVRAYAKKGTKTYTGKYSASRYIKLSQRPANVKKVTVRPGTKKLSVTAGSVKGATGYEIVVSTDKAGKKTVASKKAAKGKASFTKLGKKKTYYITVRAYKKTKSGGYLYSAKKVTKVKTK